MLSTQLFWQIKQFTEEKRHLPKEANDRLISFLSKLAIDGSDKEESFNESSSEYSDMPSSKEEEKSAGSNTGKKKKKSESNKSSVKKKKSDKTSEISEHTNKKEEIERDIESFANYLEKLRTKQIKNS